MFFGKHRLHPALLVVGDDFDGPFEVRAFKPLLSEYLADLFAFAFGIVGDVLMLHRAKEFVFLTLRADAQEVASSHAEAIADEIGDAQDEDDGIGQPGPRNAGHDCECRDSTIDRAVDEIA